MKAIASLIFALSCSSAFAGMGSTYSGESQKGIYFDFMVYELNELKEEDNPLPTGLQRGCHEICAEILSLVSYELSSGKPVERINVKYHEPFQCYLTYGDVDVIQCNSGAPLGFSKSRYTRDRSKSDIFQCVSNCSNDIPATLEEEEIPAGC